MSDGIDRVLARCQRGEVPNLKGPFPSDEVGIADLDQTQLAVCSRTIAEPQSIQRAVLITLRRRHRRRHQDTPAITTPQMLVLP
ncbi:hypothetical protein FKO01_61490 [Mesorhizobium sp. B2-3-3]|uniref:hypothetical protein n=1 Tax=Streptomyces TaxID=1883 RepID=UPI0011741F22|nr:hypothetical protein FKO01_61490 [Mesorhizobium sp. B2-3-3]